MNFKHRQPKGHNVTSTKALAMKDISKEEVNYVSREYLVLRYCKNALKAIHLDRLKL